MRLLKIGAGLAVVLAVGWSAWWLIGAKGQQTGIEAWLEAQRKRGWQAEAADINVTGYPTDFTLQMTDIALADPRTGWAWQAPTLDAASASWQPTRIAVTWPNQHALATPYEAIEIRTESMATLLDLRPGPAMELREASGTVASMVLTGRTGWSARAGSLDSRIAERPDDLAPPNSYDLRLIAEQVRLPKELVARIDPTGWLKPAVDRLTVTGHAALDAPLDRAALEDGRLAVRAATIREAGFEWGAMRLIVKGSFQVDDDGYPVGKIEIQAREWRQMIRLAVSSGVIDRGTAKTITQAVEFLTALTGGGDDLSAPLQLSGGKVRIGPVPIADAPRLAPPR